MRRGAAAAGAALLLAATLLACPSAVAQAGPEIVPPASRNVTPPGITPGPDGIGPLTREPTPRPSPSADGPQWRRFFLAVATDAGRLAVEKRQIRIAGVVAPGAADTCRVDSGTPWPCGSAALTAFRLFLRGRSVECLVAKNDESASLTAPCRLGTTDLGLWLLTHGWGMAAEAASDEYRKAQETARCAHVGMWRDEPPCS